MYVPSLCLSLLVCKVKVEITPHRVAMATKYVYLCKVHGIVSALREVLSNASAVTL